MDKRILTLGGIILLIAGIIFFMKFCNREKCTTPDIMIEPGKVATTKQLVTFTYSSANAKEDDVVHWIFDDGKEADGNSYTRYFQKAGTYVVSMTVNNNTECSKSDSVVITEAVEDTVPQKTIANYSISCSGILYTGVPFQVKAIGAGGKIFQWDFHETGNYEPKSTATTYAYKYSQVSNYKIDLLVDGNMVASKNVIVQDKPAVHTGGGAPPKPSTPDPGGEGKMMNLINQFGYAARNNDEDQQADTRAQIGRAHV